MERVPTGPGCGRVCLTTARSTSWRVRTPSGLELWSTTGSRLTPLSIMARTARASDQSGRAVIGSSLIRSRTLRPARRCSCRSPRPSNAPVGSSSSVGTSRSRWVTTPTTRPRSTTGAPEIALWTRRRSAASAGASVASRTTSPVIVSPTAPSSRSTVVSSCAVAVIIVIPPRRTHSRRRRRATKGPRSPATRSWAVGHPCDGTFGRGRGRTPAAATQPLLDLHRDERGGGGDQHDGELHRPERPGVEQALEDRDIDEGELARQPAEHGTEQEAVGARTQREEALALGPHGEGVTELEQRERREHHRLPRPAGGSGAGEQRKADGRHGEPHPQGVLPEAPGEDRLGRRAGRAAHGAALDRLQPERDRGQAVG